MNPFEVQLAQSIKKVSELPRGGDYCIEPKFDGDRWIAHIWAEEKDAVTEFTEDNDKGVTYYTRSGQMFPGERFPLITAELLRIFPDNTYVDGELVYMNPNDHKSRCNWGKVQSYVGSKDRIDEKGECSFAVFDILQLDDHEARGLPFGKRRELLDRAYAKADWSEYTFLPAQLEATDEIHDKLVELGWEGSIVKDRYAPYASGQRGRGQWKIKGEWSTEGIIMGFQEGKNGFKGMVGAIIFGQYDNTCLGCGELALIGCEVPPGSDPEVYCAGCDRTFNAPLMKRGKCSGFDMALREKMTGNPGAYKDLIIEVVHNGEMDSGGLRHPRFLRFRTDKGRHDILWSDK